MDFKKIVQWVVYSSADPAKLSLTLKAGLPFVLLLLGWSGVEKAVIEPLADEFVTDSANALALVVQAGTALVALAGLARKIYLTLLRR